MIEFRPELHPRNRVGRWIDGPEWSALTGPRRGMSTDIDHHVGRLSDGEISNLLRLKGLGDRVRGLLVDERQRRTVTPAPTGQPALDAARGLTGTRRPAHFDEPNVNLATDHSRPSAAERRYERYFRAPSGDDDTKVDIARLLSQNPRAEGEPLFEHQARVCSALTPAQRHRVLYRIRERYPPCDYIVEGARHWRREHGLPEPRVDISEVPAPLAKADRVGTGFQVTPNQATDPKVRVAFEDFKRQNAEMWDFITADPTDGGLGITVLFQPLDAGEPYPTAASQAAELRDHRRITIQSGLGGPHPLLTTEEYDRFRAVHDVFGHAGVGGGFDRHGEYQAWLAHMSMYTGSGRDAMSSEYHGVNSSLWAGAHPTPGTGKAVLLDPSLIRNPWDAEGNLVREAAADDSGPTDDDIGRLIRILGLGPGFANRFDRQPLHGGHPSLVEGRFDPARHPRGRGGEWVRSFLDQLNMAGSHPDFPGISGIKIEPGVRGGWRATAYSTRDFGTAAVPHRDPLEAIRQAHRGLRPDLPAVTPRNWASHDVGLPTGTRSPGRPDEGHLEVHPNRQITYRPAKGDPDFSTPEATLDLFRRADRTIAARSLERRSGIANAVDAASVGAAGDADIEHLQRTLKHEAIGAAYDGIGGYDVARRHQAAAEGLELHRAYFQRAAGVGDIPTGTKRTTVFRGVTAGVGGSGVAIPDRDAILADYMRRYRTQRPVVQRVRQLREKLAAAETPKDRRAYRELLRKAEDELRGMGAVV